MNFKTNKITEYNSEIIEKALRNSSLKRHTSLDLKNSYIAIKDENKYFLGYEKNSKIQFLRITSFFDRLLPNIIISFNKNNFNEYQLRLKGGSMIVFIILTILLVFKIIHSIVNKNIESDLFSIFQVYILFQILIFIEYKLITKLIKKSINDYIQYASKDTEINSDGIKGFELDKKKLNIPKNDNISGIIKGNITKQQLATEFKKLGWNVRKTAFYDYEIEGKWAELNIEGKSEILLNGIIDINKIKELKEILENMNVTYSLEIYNTKNKLTKTVANTLYIL